MVDGFSRSTTLLRASPSARNGGWAGITPPPIAGFVQRKVTWLPWRSCQSRLDIIGSIAFLPNCLSDNRSWLLWLPPLSGYMSRTCGRFCVSIGRHRIRGRSVKDDGCSNGLCVVDHGSSPWFGGFLLVFVGTGCVPVRLQTSLSGGVEAGSRKDLCRPVTYSLLRTDQVGGTPSGSL